MPASLAPRDHPPCLALLADHRHFTGYVSTKRSAGYSFVSSKHPTILGRGFFDVLHVQPSLQLQMHVLKASQRTLPRRADCSDPLATLDTVPDSNSDHGEVTVDRSVRTRIVVDDDDQTTQTAVIPRHGDATVGRRQYITARAASDVDAAMGARSWVPSAPSHAPKPVRGGVLRSRCLHSG